jgi:hypothetical protein
VLLVQPRHHGVRAVRLALAVVQIYF